MECAAAISATKAVIYMKALIHFLWSRVEMAMGHLNTVEHIFLIEAGNGTISL